MQRLIRFASLCALLALVLPVFLLFPSEAVAADTDSVTGSMTAGGKTYKLTHVSVRRQPSMNDKTKTVVVVLLTDNAVPKNVLDDKYRLELTDLAREGKIHGVSVTLGLDKKPSGTGWDLCQRVRRSDREPGRSAVVRAGGLHRHASRRQALRARDLRGREVGLHGELQGRHLDSQVASAESWPRRSEPFNPRLSSPRPCPCLPSGLSSERPGARGRAWDRRRCSG